jgi:hypothetical protein
MMMFVLLLLFAVGDCCVATSLAGRRSHYKDGGRAKAICNKRKNCYRDSIHQRRAVKANEKRREMHSVPMPPAMSPVTGYAVEPSAAVCQGPAVSVYVDSPVAKWVAFLHHVHSGLVHVHPSTFSSQQELHRALTFLLSHAHLCPAEAQEYLGLLLQRLQAYCCGIKDMALRHMVAVSIFTGIPPQSPIWAMRISGSLFFYQRLIDMPRAWLAEVLLHDRTFAQVKSEAGMPVLFDEAFYLAPDVVGKIELLRECGLSPLTRYFKVNPLEGAVSLGNHVMMEQLIAAAQHLGFSFPMSSDYIQQTSPYIRGILMGSGVVSASEPC